MVVLYTYELLGFALRVLLYDLTYDIPDVHSPTRPKNTVIWMADILPRPVTSLVPSKRAAPLRNPYRYFNNKLILWWRDWLRRRQSIWSLSKNEIRMTQQMQKYIWFDTGFWSKVNTVIHFYDGGVFAPSCNSSRGVTCNYRPVLPYTHGSSMNSKKYNTPGLSDVRWGSWLLRQWPL